MHIVLVIGIALVLYGGKVFTAIVGRGMRGSLLSRLMNMASEPSSSNKKSDGKVQYQLMNSNGSWQNSYTARPSNLFTMGQSLDRLAQQSPKGRSRALDANTGQLLDMR